MLLLLLLLFRLSIDDRRKALATAAADGPIAPIGMIVIPVDDDSGGVAVAVAIVGGVVAVAIIAQSFAV